MNIQQAIIEYLSAQSTPITRAEIVADLRQHFEAKQIGNAIDRLRNAGMIETGPSEYDSGRAVLTYQLSDQARRGHHNESLAILDENDKRQEPAPLDPLDLDHRVLVLNPDDPLFTPFASLIDALKQAQASAPKILYKAAKIKALTLIAESPLINGDIALFLSEIAQDLEQLEDAS